MNKVFTYIQDKKNVSGYLQQDRASVRGDLHGIRAALETCDYSKGGYMWDIFALENVTQREIFYVKLKHRDQWYTGLSDFIVQVAVRN